MRFLIFDTYYEEFLESVYEAENDLEPRPYAEQWRFIMDRCFGTADFYSSNLQKLGCEATEVITNCVPMQNQWAKENGINPRGEKGSFHLRKGFIPNVRSRPAKEWYYHIMKAQVAAFKPDILYVQDMNCTDPAFLREMKSHARWIVGQIACPVIPGIDFRVYDLVLTSFPHFVDYFRNQGIGCEYQKLAFEPKILEKLGRKGADYGAVFVGGISSAHPERVDLLEKVAGSRRIDFWGYGVSELEARSPLRSVYRGQAWALDMYRILYSAKIALNHHITAADRYANNMRLYEATGVGTLLVTDYKDNLGELFEIGREIVAYNSPEECLELIAYYLDHEEERQAIARAGQERTLNEHTYSHRMCELLGITERALVRASAR
jgi:hypothetical protein